MGQSIHLCEGDSLQEYWIIPSDSSNAIQWDFIVGSGAQFIDAQNTAQTRINFPLAGTYVLQFSETNQDGCVGAVTLDIVVHSLPAPAFSYQNACLGRSVYLQNTSVANSIEVLEWTVNGRVDTSYHLTETFNQEGLHPVSLYIEDEWGCSATYTEMVDVYTNPNADFYFTPDPASTLNSEVQFMNLSTANTQAYWNFGNKDSSTDWAPIYTYEDAGWHDVQLLVEDANGCVDSVQKSLLVKSDLVFYVPDVFTPNNDGDNDEFGPEGYNLEKWQSYHLKIWSQWGEIIFESTDVNHFWDGKMKSGLMAPNDIYVWSIRIYDELGKKTHHTGTMSLLR